MQFASLEERRRHTLKMLHSYVARLPITAGSARAIRMISGDAPGLSDEVERLARIDPTLAIRILYLASQRIESKGNQELTLASVMARVGSQRIASGVGELKRTALFVPEDREFDDLWLHSVQVAVLAQQLSRRIKGPNIAGEEAYLAGMLHDAGRFVMLVAAPEKAHQINLSDWHTGEELLDTEMEVTGYEHTMLGWVACREWRFPESLSYVNRYHHNSVGVDLLRMSDKIKMLVRLVDLADRISLHLVDPERNPATEWEVTLRKDQSIRTLSARLGVSEGELIQSTQAGLESLSSKGSILWKVSA